MTGAHTEHYDEGDFPPLPVVRQLRLERQDHGWARIVQGIVDSGADCSVVPKNLVMDLLERSESEQVVVEDIFGARSVLTAIRLDVQIGSLGVQRSLFVLGIDDEVILGRDLLNYYEVTLDGKPVVGQVRTLSFRE